MIEKDRMTEHVMDLIRINSLSKKEKDVAVKLQKEMEDLGAECFYDDAGEKVNGNVGNLIVKLEGNKSDAPPFFLSAHMDTVGPGEGIKPRIEDGIMKSDGTTILGSDDKSGVAVIVETIRALKDNGIPYGDIEIAFTICEEIGLLGAKHIDISKFKAKHGIVLDSSTPDRLVLRCPSADKMEFTVHGLEAHAGLCPENGMSAIKIASEAISKMKLGRIDDITTANIGVINGGRATNIIPKHVRIVGEARSHNEESLKAQVDHMRNCFHDAVSNYEVTIHDDLSIEGTTYIAKLDEHIERSYDRMDVDVKSLPVTLVDTAVKNLGYTIKHHTSGGGCDANYFNRMGIECVNLGTGMYELHTVNEYLIMEEFFRSADIVLESIRLNTIIPS
ncbi:MAG: M20/M25/M40 family metallo-hydrolase [Candidatus Dadabacteria bacterium]|nr:M20/M25/M40 family metallo-hydrolase [Candidatus Dadabacteria bacterium]TDI92171.1 MAG: M20/M25/M40 family metallo-hydrolase [Candidatus Dadabacteria bacterium]TDI99770.1 MAG: M20/M25/M40 family metallo-hydrolase [Candidatus Dadabacteria bacterium]